MLEMVHDITARRCKGWGGELFEFSGEPDHVHAVVSLPPNLDLSRFVNNQDHQLARGAPRVR